MLAPARVVTSRRVLTAEWSPENLTAGKNLEGLKNARAGATGRVEWGKKARVEIRSLAIALEEYGFGMDVVED